MSAINKEKTIELEDFLAKHRVHVNSYYEFENIIESLRKTTGNDVRFLNSEIKEQNVSLFPNMTFLYYGPNFFSCRLFTSRRGKLITSKELISKVKLIMNKDDDYECY